MFIAELFMIGKLWKHPRCPTTDGWMKKIPHTHTHTHTQTHTHTMEYYLAIKKIEILLFTGE
jgi:hypothetical protein